MSHPIVYQDYLAVGCHILDPFNDTIYTVKEEVREGLVGDIIVRTDLGHARARAMANALNRGGPAAERVRRRMGR